MIVYKSLVFPPWLQTCLESHQLPVLKGWMSPSVLDNITFRLQQSSHCCQIWFWTVQPHLRARRSRQRRCDSPLPMTQSTRAPHMAWPCELKCWLPTVPHFQLHTTPLLSCRCTGLHIAPLLCCSSCAACGACPHSPSALPQVAVQLLRMLNGQAAHLRGLSEELAVQQWLAEVDGRLGPDAVPAQASPRGCCSWLANSRQQAHWICHSQWGCDQAKAAPLGSELHHARCLGQNSVVDMQMGHTASCCGKHGFGWLCINC